MPSLRSIRDPWYDYSQDDLENDDIIAERELRQEIRDDETRRLKDEKAYRNRDS